MTTEIKDKNYNTKKELKNILFLTVACCMVAFNLNSFIDAGGLFPGGFSGITVLVQQIFERFFDLEVAYSVIYLPLNLVPIYIGVRYISKKFTLYSVYVVFLSSILTDIFPSFAITYDTLLISIFGGIINGAAISLTLMAGGSCGGTDFISIYFSEKKGIDAWNYILIGNVIILTTAGILFGFDKALYSIIYQFTSTQVIQILFKRYQKDTLLIVTTMPEPVYQKIRELTHHDATLINGTGCYEKREKAILYSVIGREQVDKVVSAIRVVDPHAFVNVINTDQLDGRFYKAPY